MDKLSFRESLSYFLENITVEPIIALLIIPSVFSSFANQNLNLQKACSVNLNFSDKICLDLVEQKTSNLKKEEIQVQRLVADMMMWTSLFRLISLVLVMFSGSWSDRKRKRKPFLLIPIVGEFITVLGLMMCVYFSSMPMQVSGFIGAFLPAITGGWTVTFMAAFSYIGDITEENVRTVRIGFVNVFCSGGIPIGTALSGVLLKWFGFYGVFSLAGAFYFTGFIYGLYQIKEANEINCLRNKGTQNALNSLQLSEFDEFKNSAVKKWDFWFLVKDFFNTDHIRETLKVAYKDNPKNRRKNILLLIVVLIVVEGPLYGEMTVMYLFMRYKFNWNEVQYSMFSTYNVITHLLGTAFSVGVFSHMLKIDDALIGVMSSMSKILAGFVYAFAQTEWQIYIAPLVDIVNGTSFIAMRSIASKLVPPEELGKLNSLYGACEALTPLVYGPMYAFVYAHTMDILPGGFMLLGGALTLPAVFIFGWMYTQHKKEAIITHQHLSQEPSLTGEITKTLQVDPQENKNVKGVDNLAIELEKVKEKY